MINSWMLSGFLEIHPVKPMNDNNVCCSFEMIRASFQQEWANGGLYVIHGHKAPKASVY